MSSSTQPIICFGQQPCGFFPKRFLYAKIVTARRLQAEIGGEIVFFFHDSDHDPRETSTALKERRSGREHTVNFRYLNRIQKEFSPLFAKRILSDWRAKMTRQLPNYVDQNLVEKFGANTADNPADFCLQMYQSMGLLDGLRVDRSGDPVFRRKAIEVEDRFVDVQWEGETVRARCRDGKLLLHQGGDKFIEVPWQEFDRSQVSPTRDSRLRWMQSVIQCTHYIAGAGERQYLNEADAPGVKFVPRIDISEQNQAYIGD
ncbi:MAG TPA: hypothetical protein VGM62_13205 [Chthoniobacterales bacterium]|jgi:hypothetical protein